VEKVITIFVSLKNIRSVYAYM